MVQEPKWPGLINATYFGLRLFLLGLNYHNIPPDCTQLQFLVEGVLHTYLQKTLEMIHVDLYCRLVEHLIYILSSQTLKMLFGKAISINQVIHWPYSWHVLSLKLTTNQLVFISLRFKLAINDYYKLFHTFYYHYSSFMIVFLRKYLLHYVPMYVRTYTMAVNINNM